MRAVAQRVVSASVTVDHEVISLIGRGLLVLVGIGTGDVQADIDMLTKKIVTLRMWPDPATNSAWKLNVKDIGGEILCVSQFTLMANTTKGNKPDFHRAMGPESSRVMYETVLDKLRVLHDPTKVKDGRFGAMMNVSLTNDGPVTFTLDSRKADSAPSEDPTTLPDVAQP